MTHKKFIIFSEKNLNALLKRSEKRKKLFVPQNRKSATMKKLKRLKSKRSEKQSVKLNAVLKLRKLKWNSKRNKK